MKFQALEPAKQVKTEEESSCNCWHGFCETCDFCTSEDWSSSSEEDN